MLLKLQYPIFNNSIDAGICLAMISICHRKILLFLLHKASYGKISVLDAFINHFVPTKQYIHCVLFVYDAMTSK